jgi:hypothetical protein
MHRAGIADLSRHQSPPTLPRAIQNGTDWRRVLVEGNSTNSAERHGIEENPTGSEAGSNACANDGIWATMSAMGFDIKFDPPLDEFSRNLERQVKNISNTAIETFGRGLQAACDEVFAARDGKTADQLFDELRDNLDRRDLPVTLEDEKVRHYAEAIAEGRKINVKLPDPM